MRPLLATLVALALLLTTAASSHAQYWYTDYATPWAQRYTYTSPMGNISFERGTQAAYTYDWASRRYVPTTSQYQRTLLGTCGASWYVFGGYC